MISLPSFWKAVSLGVVAALISASTASAQLIIFHRAGDSPTRVHRTNEGSDELQSWPPPVRVARFQKPVKEAFAALVEKVTWRGNVAPEESATELPDTSPMATAAPVATAVPGEKPVPMEGNGPLEIAIPVETIAPVNVLRPLPLSPLPPSTPHEVIQSPYRPPHRTGKLPLPESAHPPHLSRHHATQVSRAVLREASQVPVWKTPYSYGYFGASGSKHWSRHFGYRDRSTVWRLR